MRFQSHEMPEYVPIHGVQPLDQRILEIYNQIGGSRLDPKSPSDQHVLLEEFVDRETFIALDEASQDVVSVGVYVQTSDRTAEITGLAVDRVHRKKHIGSYMTQRLVGVARLDSIKTVELMSVPEAVRFWTLQGFNSQIPNPAIKSVECTKIYNI